MIIICGPTSTGKTSLAIKLCKEFNGEIISADSRQIYKYMDVGTGKIPINADFSVIRNVGKWEINKINIWGYDLINPDNYFSAYDYATYALKKIKQVQTTKTPFLVGGTGFYIDSVTGVTRLSGVKPDFERRKSLETTPTKNLLNKLKRLNYEVYEKVDKKNRVRIIRALELELNKKSNSNPLQYLENTNISYIGLTASRDILYQRVDDWVESIWASLVEEVKVLIAEGYKNSNPMKGIVYKTAIKFIDENIPCSEAKQEMKYNLHAYIRRQLTWFKKNEHIKWFDIVDTDIYEKVKTYVKTCI